jgi:hypothetical protein
MHELTVREPGPPPVAEQLVDVTPTAKPPTGVDDAPGDRDEEAASPHPAIALIKAPIASAAPTLRAFTQTAGGIRGRRSAE